MNAFRSKPLKYPWPPLLYSLAIVGALFLERSAPLLLPLSQSIAMRVVGVLLIVAAVWLELWTMTTILDSRVGKPSRRRAPHLITQGPFRYTRNPVYLGYTSITLGFGLWTGSLWFVVAAVAAAIATTSVAIRREEIVLLSRFGCDFETYCRQTRRWI
ncbi:methyltransferase [Rhizobium sp. 2YAF20]|uniref:methyltransferase family protein n=1 Tax=Rhizobium sp. 2YAF20 TaxID=3233027 RepID=UPI003F9E1640